MCVTDGGVVTNADELDDAVAQKLPEPFCSPANMDELDAKKLASGGSLCRDRFLNGACYCCEVAKRAQMRPPLVRDSGKAARRAKRVAHLAKAATVAAGAAAAADTAAATPPNDRAAT